MAQTRTAYLDVLRVIACVLVVGVHVSALCLEEIDVTGVNFKVMNGFDCFSIYGVPLFVMISGSLLLAKERTDSMKYFYFRKAGKLFFLYFFWLLFYNTCNFIRDGKVWSLEGVKQDIVLESLLGRGIYHLWFLPMMISLYLITPFIKPFMEDKIKCIVFCGFYFVIAILLPTMLKFEFPYKTIVGSLYERFPKVMFIGYIGYYIWGHVLHEFLPKLSGKLLAGVVALGLIAFVTEVYVCNLYSEKTGELSIILNDTMAVNAFTACSAIYILGKHCKVKESRMLHSLSGLTFGVYLLHPFVLDLLNQAGINTLFAPAAVAVPVMVLLVSVLTGILVFVLQKIPGLRQLV